MEVRRKDIMSAVCRVNSGEGVVVLTDIPSRAGRG
jgi:PTS system mannose-specific IIA component